jgi:predicted permease
MDLAIVGHAVQGVLTLFILGSVGYIISKVGWASTEVKILLNKLVLFVALPPFMLYNITTFMSREDLLRLSYGLVVPFVSIILTFVLSWLLVKILKVSRVRKGVFCCGFTMSNTIFIGLPVNLAMFGESSVPFVLLYYFANTAILWTVGNYAIAASGNNVAENGTTRQLRFFSRASLKQIFSPPILGLLAGLSILLLGLPLPEFIKDSARYLGFITTPLALMIIGINMQKVPFSKIRLSRDLIIVLVGRFVLSPLIVVALCLLIPLPDLMRKVFIVQSSLPAMVNLAVLASYHKSDEEFATLIVAASTMLSMVTIPIVVLLV